MNLLKSNLLAGLLICLLITSCSKEDSVEVEAAKYDIDLALAQKNDSQMSSEILSLINDHRVLLGLPVLKADNKYTSAFAVKHTQYMIEKEYINHDNFGYRSEEIKFHDNAQVVGENVAYGYETAEKVVEAWLQSPGHKAIIEGNYTHTGFGVMKSDKDRSYFTQLFYRK
ncbi:CAP domain-containing protein [Aequorivita capsosiphonis]|uniref:CAP domain-containing protein n=1 Tax=Aequorivita capsosiphonis TaxID=487317 RepID=UPI00047E3DFA|nr:CAP domain-containing protein [Aequorivita capsosiphonis]